MLNKRGISQLADVIFAIILFTLFFVILMWVMGTARMQVSAKVEAANAVFVCQNDLSAVMQFPSDDGQIKDTLVKDYMGYAKEPSGDEESPKDNLPNFNSKIKSTFDELVGEGNWDIKVIHGKDEINKVGEITNRYSEECSVFVPVKCDTRGAEDEVEYEKELMKCNLEVKLTLGYDKK